MSSPNLDLSLPEAPKSSRGGLLPVITALASIASVVLLALLLVRGGGSAGSGADGSGGGAAGSDAEHLHALAIRLEERTLFAEAARAWEEYERTASLDEAELAETAYRRGRCLQRAGEAEAAAALFTRVELVAGRDQRRKAQRHLLETLSTLGKEEVREHLLRETTVEGSVSKSPVVARVGEDKITIDEIKTELVAQMEAQVAMMNPAADPDAMAAQISSLVSKQLESAKTLRPIVEQVLTGKVLYREALSRGLGQGAEHDSAVGRFRRTWLAQQLIDSLRKETLRSITEVDVKNHYNANLESYVDPEDVGFSSVRFASEPEAKTAIAALASDADAAESIAERFEPAPSGAVAGKPLPGLGASPTGVAQLLAAEVGQVVDVPVKVGDAWYILRCDAKNASRQKTLDEVRAEARADLARAKEQEAISKLQARLATKFSAEILMDDLKSALEADKKADAGDSDAK